MATKLNLKKVDNMDYKKGIVQLQEKLKKINEKEAIRQVEALETQLDKAIKCGIFSLGNDKFSPEPKCVFDNLDKIAYRMTGESFIGLCKGPKEASFSLTLRCILLFVLASMLIFSLGIAVASSTIKSNARVQVEQIRQEIEAIELRIAIDIKSPFYLSRKSPCSDNLLREIVIMDNMILKRFEDENCVWQYKEKKSDQIIVIDKWDKWRYRHGPFLQKREYYRYGNMIALDSFGTENTKNAECFMLRKYFDNQGQILTEVCYSEAGRPLSQDFRDSLRSAIPPTLYWFFYR